MPGLAGLPILPVDVNASAGDWLVEPVPQLPGEGLRAGLREVKGISDGEVTRIVAGQPYASLRDLWERAAVSRPVAERLVLVGALDSLYAADSQLSRRDLLARVGVLDRRTRAGAATGQAVFGFGGDGFAELVPAGELRELTPLERVEAELSILGIDLSQHVISFYQDLLGQLGVVRSADLRGCPAGERILVAGVKIATQTPAIRSGMRIIFATLDDATGPVDLAFFESVQPRCAARVFGSWLLVACGRVRRTGESVSVNAEECWIWPRWRRSVRTVASPRSAPPWPRETCPGPAGRPAAARHGQPGKPEDHLPERIRAVPLRRGQAPRAAR